MKTSAPSLFTLYTIQISVFHCLNTALRVILLMYCLNQLSPACNRNYIHLIRANLSFYVFIFPSTYAMSSVVFMQISYFKASYKNTVSTSIVWKYHLLIKHKSIMMCSVTSVTTGKYFLVNSTPGILLYPCSSRYDLYGPSLFFFKTHFDSIGHLFYGILLLFPYTFIYHVLELL